MAQRTNDRGPQSLLNWRDFWRFKLSFPRLDTQTLVEVYPRYKVPGARSFRVSEEARPSVAVGAIYGDLELTTTLYSLIPDEFFVVADTIPYA